MGVMTQNVIDMLLIIIGLVVTPIMFFRFPRLSKSNRESYTSSLSIIIPARNEEKSLPLLLEDLCAQSCQPLEIICVDDDSSDSTAQIAESFGVRVISLHDKPQGWLGKTWACHNGANAAKGDLLLFLDADVRLGPNAISRLLETYSEQNCTISVQPYHVTEELYEQFSLPFNLIQIAANGTTLPKQKSVGLFGPVILISKNDHIKIGGHESVRKNIIEDIALGQKLKEAGLPFDLFVGDKDLSYRMYNDGVRGLLQGWIKNIAAGAAKTHWYLFIEVFLAITSMASVPIHIAAYSLSANYKWLILYVVLYMIWVLVLYILAQKAGRFRLLPIILYPILIIVLVCVFLVSMLKKIFGLKVVWKGRAIN